MKKLFLLALVLVMSCTVAFAQSPEADGKSFGKELLKVVLAEDEAALQEWGVELQSYVEENIQTEEDFANFFNGLEVGLREGCKANGFSAEETDELIDMIRGSLFEAMMGYVE